MGESSSKTPLSSQLSRDRKVRPPAPKLGAKGESDDIIESPSREGTIPSPGLKLRVNVEMKPR